jgi:hypothetical protein
MMPPWTYSRLGAFETCPKQFFHTKVNKDVVEGDTVATLWGKKVHTAFENAIESGTPLPEGMTQWQSLADKFARLPGEKLVEYKFAVDKNFQPSEWDGAWSRGIADLVVRHNDRVLVADWKTGKKKPTEQLDLYAGYIMAKWPETKVIQTAFVWLKDRKLTKKNHGCSRGCAHHLAGVHPPCQAHGARIRAGCVASETVRAVQTLVLC